MKNRVACKLVTLSFFFLNDTPPTEFYPLPLHAALPICPADFQAGRSPDPQLFRSILDLRGAQIMISVVIPALNEARSVGATVTNIAGVLVAANMVPFEIIVVDDGSTDGTGQVAAQAGAPVVRHPPNVGYGRALPKGN